MIANRLQPKTARRAFTLIELLTVIAIIAILAALIFPTFSRVRESARQTSCMSQMHDVYRALKLYRDDNNKYPAALLGFVQDTDKNFYNGPGTGTPLRIEKITYRPLTKAQKYVKDKDGFICPDSTYNIPPDGNPDPNKTYTTSAVYPKNVILTGDVVFTDLIAHNIKKPVTLGNKVWYYRYDSYDTGPQVDKDGNTVKNPDGTPVIELHYSLDWTGNLGPADVDSAGQPLLNQLKYPNPPEDKTVVTWCTYHVSTAHSNVIPVLMLSGVVKPVPLSRFATKGPLALNP